jgi:transcriptional regulator with XRE-family HTH domain
MPKKKAAAVQSPSSSARPAASAENIALGSAIQKARLAAGVTQEQLARSLNVTVGNVSKWERGTVNVLFPVLCKIAAALNTTPETIVSEAQRQ